MLLKENPFFKIKQLSEYDRPHNGNKITHRTVRWLGTDVFRTISVANKGSHALQTHCQTEVHKKKVQHNVTMYRYFIIHSYCLVILLDFSLKMHQIDAFKYEIFNIFFRGNMFPDRVESFSTFSLLTRFHA